MIQLGIATIKKRINITVDDSTYKALEKLARQQSKSVSRVGLNLIEKALELQEGFHFSKIADERIDKGEKRTSHNKAWE